MLTQQAFIAIILFNFIAGIIIFVGIIVLLLVEEKLTLANTERLRAMVERQLHESRFIALSSQIRPHFLYNTLNALSSLVHLRRNDQAQELLHGLSGMMRYCTDQEHIETTLSEEINYVSKYLKIQQIRYEDRLKFEISIPESLCNLRVPFMLLQPIVENACEYGINTVTNQLHIRISALVEKEGIEIHIDDQGAGFPKEAIECFSDWKKGGVTKAKLGVGLTNSYQRLVSFFGTSADMEILSVSGNGTKVIIKIPNQGSEDVG